MSRIAIVSAMHQELRALLPALDRHQSATVAGRTFHIGTMEGQPVVMALSGIGKVAAATTATLLLQEIDVQRIVFTGAAGGLGTGVRVGDVVVARELLQHDMDASPLFPRYEVPLTGRSRFPTDPDLSDALASAALHCLQRAAERIGEAHRPTSASTARCCTRALVVSGDRFVATAAESNALRGALPDALAVEMEGAALAQVCADFGRPFAVIRTISDRADDSAHVDFNRFIAEVASVYTREILSTWMSGAVE
ncbi:5'-methylthioadenosine/adenosylhomocysteine nucleosidase [Piscinibacter aquaticus]|uniref:adenosylhomocysteine nucleosidase n=1 Tax=Piscinibacter aquaticus TaxID=392597 RepID=A0A5C6U5N8_9BURK|nr:5'-methylthioadenosine/adenosylhomocysteine nucleosidase [Piscinibacter aquaticus]